MKPKFRAWVVLTVDRGVVYFSNLLFESDKEEFSLINGDIMRVICSGHVSILTAHTALLSSVASLILIGVALIREPPPIASS